MKQSTVAILVEKVTQNGKQINSLPLVRIWIERGIDDRTTI